MTAGMHGGTDASMLIERPAPVAAPDPIVVNRPRDDFGDAT